MDQTTEGSPAGPADDKAVESLKDQHGDQAAERVAASTGGSTRKIGGHAAAFEMWTDEELHEKAAELGIEHEGVPREQLIDTLQGH